MFCDEPTTGLDSFNARTVIKALKYLSESHADDSPSLDRFVLENDSASDNSLELIARNKKNKAAPKAIICSIHQPTSDIFQCFSHIILMHAGKSVFQGTADEAFEYFSRFFCLLIKNR